MQRAFVFQSGNGTHLLSVVRTGQPHRTLLGHTAPVTCLQFDELHIVTGSLDKSIRVRSSLWLSASKSSDAIVLYYVFLRRPKIWDVRTGGIFETLKYDHAVTALQFDTRKIVAATGEILSLMKTKL